MRPPAEGGRFGGPGQSLRDATSQPVVGARHARHARYARRASAGAASPARIVVRKERRDPTGCSPRNEGFIAGQDRRCTRKPAHEAPCSVDLGSPPLRKAAFARPEFPNTSNDMTPNARKNSEHIEPDTGEASSLKQRVSAAARDNDGARGEGFWQTNASTNREAAERRPPKIQENPAQTRRRRERCGTRGSSLSLRRQAAHRPSARAAIRSCARCAVLLPEQLPPGSPPRPPRGTPKRRSAHLCFCGCPKISFRTIRWA